ncbi:MAG: 2OG-Fe(II) oxygenase [Deltaproteobacteria bacterium]|nr:2OG-Fe(II) oxygenase [Deltaproteobacteria bacterium]
MSEPSLESSILSSGKTEQSSQIRLYRKVFPTDACREIIRVFRDSPDKVLSHVHNGSPEVTRQGKVVNLKPKPEYEEARKLLFGIWRQVTFDFARHDPGLKIMVAGRFLFSHPRIEEVQPEQEFTWHIDARQTFQATRFLTILTYLNDVAEGGETEFSYQGIKVQPEEGSILVFPPYWTHVHRGAPPRSGVKYTAGTYAMVERVMDQPAGAKFRPPPGNT